MARDIKEGAIKALAHSESGFVEIRGTRIYYEELGAGPTLVLIHEGLADRRMYDAQFEPLAAHYHVLRYDMPGFGRSDVAQQPYSQHEILYELLRHRAIERATLWGMSLGGEVALDFAISYPSMVRALVLMASGIGGYPIGQATKELAVPIAEAFKSGDFTRAMDLSVRLWFDGRERNPQEVDPAVRERFRQLYTDVLARSREGGQRAVLLDPPACTRLGEIRVPTLVVVGSGDIQHVLDEAELLERSIPGAHRVVLPRLAHLLNMERPEEVNQLVRGFLTALG